MSKQPNKTVKNISRKELSWMVDNLDLILYKKKIARKVILVVDGIYRIFIDGQHTSVERENRPFIALKESEMPQ